MFSKKVTGNLKQNGVDAWLEQKLNLRIHQKKLEGRIRVRGFKIETLNY